MRNLIGNDQNEVIGLLFFDQFHSADIISILGWPSKLSVIDNEYQVMDGLSIYYPKLYGIRKFVDISHIL